MTGREAKRLALLGIVRSVRAASATLRHPETGDVLAEADVRRVEAEVRIVLETIERRASRLRSVKT